MSYFCIIYDRSYACGRVARVSPFIFCLSRKRRAKGMMRTLNMTSSEMALAYRIMIGSDREMNYSDDKDAAVRRCVNSNYNR
jgi:hypothetical protein